MHISLIFLVVFLTIIVPVKTLAEYPDPTRTITIVIPTGAGDGMDVLGRVIGEEMRKRFGCPVIILNKPGASGAIAADHVARAKNDGYTLLFTFSAPMTSYRVFYQTIHDIDAFVPVCSILFNASVLSSGQDAPFKNFQEMIEYSKTGKIACSTLGPGTIGDLNLEILKSSTGFEPIRVPGKSGMESIVLVLGGHANLTIASMGNTKSFLRDKLRGILTSEKYSNFPQIPTLRELGYPEDLFSIWYAFFAPKDTPLEVRKKLTDTLKSIVGTSEFAEKSEMQGYMVDFIGPEGVTERINAEFARMKKIAGKEK